MPGMNDPDRVKSEEPIKPQPQLPQIERFLTDEEWWESENYKILKERSLNRLTNDK